MNINQHLRVSAEGISVKKPIDIKGGKRLIFTIENTMINHGQDCSHFTVQAGKIVNSVLTDSRVQIVAAGSL